MFNLENEENKLKSLLRIFILFHLLCVLLFTYIGLKSEVSLELLVTNFNIYEFIYLIFYISSIVLLFILNPYGKIFFTLLVIEGVIASFSSPERIITLEDSFIFLTYFEGILDGAILVIIYLTPLKKYFKSVKGFLWVKN